VDIVPPEVQAPLRAGLWQPLMWAYCEGPPIGMIAIVAIPGPLIVRTVPATVAGVLLFLLGWFVLRTIGKADPKAFRVFQRAQRYRNGRTATLPARASWQSPRIDYRVRVH
jgi:hypothetical protein